MSKEAKTISIDISGEKFDFFPEVLSTMLDSIEETSKDRRERGFYLCGTPRGIKPGMKCTGQECSITIKDCGNRPTVGLFHTHPGMDSFSLPDSAAILKIATGFPKHKHLDCVGLSDKEIRCRRVKEIPSSQINFGSLLFGEELVESYLSEEISITVNQVKDLLKSVSQENLEIDKEPFPLPKEEKPPVPSTEANPTQIEAENLVKELGTAGLLKVAYELGVSPAGSDAVVAKKLLEAGYAT